MSFPDPPFPRGPLLVISAHRAPACSPGYQRAGAQAAFGVRPSLASLPRGPSGGGVPTPTAAVPKTSASTTCKKTCEGDQRAVAEQASRAPCRRLKLRSAFAAGVKRRRGCFTGARVVGSSRAGRKERAALPLGIFAKISHAPSVGTGPWQRNRRSSRRCHVRVRLTRPAAPRAFPGEAAAACR